MTAHSLLHTACKILGLFFFVLAALQVRDIIYSVMVIAIDPPGYQDQWILSALFPMYAVIVNIVGGLLFIYKADWITRKLQVSTTGELNIAVGKRDLIELAVIMISLLALLTSVPQLLHKLVSYAYVYDREEGRNVGTNSDIALLLFFVFKFVAGLFLLLNARYLANWLTRVGETEDARSEIQV